MVNERTDVLAKMTALLTVTDPTPTLKSGEHRSRKKVGEKEGKIAEQNGMLKVKDAKLGRREVSIAKTDVELAAKKALAEKEARLKALAKEISNMGTGVQTLAVRGLVPLKNGA